LKSASPVPGTLTRALAWYNLGMAHDDGPNHYHVRATHPTTAEQVGFGQLTLAAANAKAAELGMGGYRDVIISIPKPPTAN
jgi:hypothetical protein